ncbi:class I SAM-dependent methyltransferase [Algoriphagus sediminis]|uniref:Class I SAM-dependent methyltransferase n=1 Tax=Algoriphagus sediminis TaxID=3057113 RepID=A0ABT7YG61_9BACT|nr:class I SAM-dependent methyltransferase [Algoriphagus sediminis]MDN3205518.1 class I SAM-dependent methyltransferase [Algoriphagus sediminis]
MKEFNTSKKRFKNAFRRILKEGDGYEIGEAALPAYTHKNPFIDWLFWERIKIAYNFANKHKSVDKILDFGCGSGVLSYMLAEKHYTVTACDIEFAPLELVKSKIEFPRTINFIEGDILTHNLMDNSFDIIFALDVLEHIEDLEPYIDEFHRLLSPNGIILISGPTENIFYKIGRKIAGSRFTGDYHVTNISIIKETFKKKMKIFSLTKLLFPVVLFELFTAQKNS